MKHSPAVWIALFMLTGTTALAQTTRPDTSVKERAAAEGSSSKDLLAGPKVDDAAAGDTDSRFGGPRRARSRITVPIRQWFGLLTELDLDEDQALEVRRIVQSFQKAARAHQQANGRRLRELQGEVREARSAGQAVPAEVRRELEKLRSLAPKPAAYQVKIWRLLTESQQQTMRARVAQIRQRIAERRAAQSTSDGRPQTGLDDRARRRIAFLRAHRLRRDKSDEAKDER